jgi:hypothetical protein
MAELLEANRETANKKYLFLTRFSPAIVRFRADRHQGGTPAG